METFFQKHFFFLIAVGEIGPICFSMPQLPSGSKQFCPDKSVGVWLSFKALVSQFNAVAILLNRKHLKN